MRRFDDTPLDPDAETALAVIDATLAGEAVEPEHAELAELALILAGQRPLPTAAFSDALDDRVAQRFAPPAKPGKTRRSRRRWLYAPGAAVGLAATVAIVVGVSSLPQGSSSGASRTTAETVTAASSSAAGGQPLTPAASGTPERAASSKSSAATSSGSNGSLSGSTGAAAASSSAPATAPAPPTGGRQVVQSAQLSLSTRPDQVDTVAQQVFDVVGAQNGVVENSTVTANNSSSGYAQFQLSVPSSNLQPTMSALSRLHGASVVSRTDSSQDITGQVGGAGRRLADARALRTSLLRQLAAATTQTQIDSLKVQIHDAETSISDDLTKLNALHHQVNNTQISVTINASMLPGHPVSSGGGFTIGKAAHDAGRVLVVAAGGALIALAVLVPLSLLGAIAFWLGLTLRRRRREQVLDLV
jgi:hypothetical protein